MSLGVVAQADALDIIEAVLSPNPDVELLRVMGRLDQEKASLAAVSAASFAAAAIRALAGATGQSVGEIVGQLRAPIGALPRPSGLLVP